MTEAAPVIDVFLSRDPGGKRVYFARTSWRPTRAQRGDAGQVEPVASA